MKDVVVGDLQNSLNRTEEMLERQTISSSIPSQKVNSTEDFDSFLLGLTEFIFEDFQSNLTKTSLEADDSEKLKSIVITMKNLFLQDLKSTFNVTDQDMENNSTQKLSSTKLGEILQSMKEFFLVDLQSSFNKTSQEKEAKDQIKITPSFNKEKLEADLLFFLIIYIISCIIIVI